MEDKGAYIASGLNDGPFFTLLFLGISGLDAERRRGRLKEGGGRTFL